MIRNAEAFLGDERFVGRTLEELLWPAEVNAERMKYPDPDSIQLAPEVPSSFEWRV